MNPYKAIIEDIRKNKFGVGLETDPRAKNVIKHLREDLNDAVKELSEGLYTKDNHFVLELIQNADDNAYRDGEEPFLQFEIDEDRVAVRNNEKGFEEKHVRALCAVGKTTKSKRLGYLGEKGIGFKSVFLVTNEPHIFSNGFQFKFKRKDEKDDLGFIIPHWVEQVPEQIEPNITNILLPLRENVKQQITKFRDIEPAIILFLNKLRTIEILNKLENKRNRIHREGENGRVILKHSGTDQNWLTVKLRIKDLPKDEKRVDITESELVLGFLLNRDGTVNTAQEQNAFAYLPIRAYGFRFIIQADFLVLSNREDIQKDRPWNKTIAQSIPEAFITKALQEFKQDASLATTYYDIIPLPGEITDEFFAPAANNIVQRLKGTESVLTESGGWAKPEDVYYPDEDIRRIVTNDDLKKAFNKEYVASAAVISDKTRSALGINPFETEDLLEFLKDKETIRAKPAKWFVELYAYLGGKKLSEEQWKQIRELKIFRLDTGELTSLSEGPIFLPLDRKTEYGFENELRITRNPKHGQDKEIQTAARKFIETAGIRRASPYKIIEDHILPFYENGAWKDKPFKILTGYVKFIKDNLAAYEKEKAAQKPLDPGKPKPSDPLSRIWQNLRLRIKTTDKTAHEYALPRESYLTKLYGAETDFEKLFEGVEGPKFIHDQYLIRYDDRSSKKQKRKKQRKQFRKIAPEIEQWHDFLIRVGVSETLIAKIDPETKRIEGPSFAANTVTGKRIPWSETSRTVWKDESWSETEYSYYIEDDWICDDLNNLFEKIATLDEPSRNKTCEQLTDNLLKTWKRHRRHTTCKYFFRTSGQHGWPSDTTKSSFLLTLMSHDWLLTEAGSPANPTRVFNQKPEIKQLLGDSVEYTAFTINNEEFLRDLGIRQEASVEEVLDYLQDTTRISQPEKTRFQKIYEFMNDNFVGKEDKIREAFQNHPLTFLPDTEQQFFALNQIIWTDVSEIFGANKGYLEKHYPSLKTFFVDKLEVSVKPSPKDYANTLKDIAKKEKLARTDETVIRKIYLELEQNLDPGKKETLVSEEDWWKDFTRSPVFLTNKGTFWKNDNDIFINDDNDIHDLFKDDKTIAFLKIPKNFHPKISHFLEGVGIRKVSEEATPRPIIGNEAKLRPDITNKLKVLMPYILRYLFQKENSLYQKLKEGQGLSQVIGIKCYSLPVLHVEYKLLSCTVYSERAAVLHQGSLYIQEDSTSTDYLTIELSKLFGSPKGLDDFIAILFSKADKEQIEAYLQAKGIQELPDEETEGIETEISDQQADDQTESDTGETTEGARDAKQEEPTSSRPQGGTGHKYRSGETTESGRTDHGTASGGEQPKDWEQECEPEDAETNVEQYQGEKREPKPDEPTTRKKGTSGTRTDEDDEADQEEESTEVKNQIGEWGERYALKCLIEKFLQKYEGSRCEQTDEGFEIKQNNQSLVKVKWLNKNGDIGIGYDIEVFESGQTNYIEVKSTKTDKKEWFHVSGKQWEKMEEHGRNYTIFRVYNAGKEKEARLKTIEDPAKLWREKLIRAFPVKLEI